jgi:hypothetical protein
MKSWVLAFAFLVLAGQARAQGNECVQPSTVPEGVYETITEEAAFDFGDVDASVCESIVKKAVATCKSQVKLQAKCYRKLAATNFEIAAKQCKQLVDPIDREDCKAFFKATKDEIDDDVELDKQEGLGVCEGAFAGELAGVCEFGIP